LGGYLEIALEKTPTLSILHALCLEYINALEDPNKFLPLVHTIIPAISHTKDGAIIAMMALAHGGAKERKVMLKEIKASAVTMSKGEYGHWVIMQMFECVDDTVLLSKNIIQVWSTISLSI
jgi:pumilio family protein 6